MQIVIKILGDELYRTVSAGKAIIESTFLKFAHHGDVFDIRLEQLHEPVTADQLLCDPQEPAVLLAHCEDSVLFERLAVLERRELINISRLDPQSLVASVILVFDQNSTTNDGREFPDLVSDWFYLPLSMAEVARRVIYALRRKGVLKVRLRFGPISLEPETRSMNFMGRSQSLSRSEFALAELFLSQMGSVIPTADLIALFKSTGKSVEGSNIRVTIFQLRLKLEMLTKSQYTLASVYKQGYCLKPKQRLAPAPRVAQTPTPYRVSSLL